MSTLNTVKKIGPVLDLFTPERPEWRMSDIARALDMPKSSAHALVSTLAEVGLLSTSAGGRYRLGWNLLSLSERMRASLDFRQHAVPAMQELSRETRETVLLAALDRQDVVYIERVEGTHPMVRLAGVRPGARAPASCTAVGKILLAYREPEEVRTVMASAPYKRFTANTIGSLEDLETELVEVRAKGIAYDRGEISTDIQCVAAPIRDRYESVIAAVSVSIPAYRFPRDPRPLVASLTRSARLISERVAEADLEPATPLEADIPGLATIT